MSRLRPKIKKDKVLESTIKSLPTKSTQVSSVQRMPHIRNQHVNLNKEQPKDKHKAVDTTPEAQQYTITPPNMKMNIDSKSFVFHRYTTPKGTEVNLDMRAYTPEIDAGMLRAVDKAGGLDKVLDQHVKEVGLDYFSARSFGAGTEKGQYGFSEIKMSPDFMKDMGFDHIFDAAGKNSSFQLNVGFNDDRMRYSLTMDKATATKEVNYMGEVGRVGENLNTYASMCEIEGSEIKDQGTGTAVHIQQQKTFMKMVDKFGLDKHVSKLDAGLATGGYIWPECGYTVDKDDRVSLLSLFEDSLQFERKVNMHGPTSPDNVKQVRRQYLEFMGTGDTDCLKRRINIDYPEGSTDVPHGSVEELYKSIMGGQSFGASMVVNKGDTPHTNLHLKKANARSIKKFGKSAW